MTLTETQVNGELEKYAGICYDSRAVSENYIFVCIKGETVDGHKFAKQAVEAGASLIVYQKNLLSQNDLEELRVINQKMQADNSALLSLEFLQAENSRAALADLAARFYKEPSRDLSVIGVTGTNGKTTVSHLIQNILSAKSPCAALGTIGFREKADSPYIDMGNTTPQSADLQKTFSDVLKKNIDYMTMEVSSHALDQSRVANIDFKAALVTNLSQDHLDYHMTMDKYFAAKAKIFDLVSDYVVLNADDDYYERFRNAAMAGELSEQNKVKIISYSVENDSDLRAENIEYSAEGLSFDLVYSNYLLQILNQDAESFKGLRFKTKLNGLFNVYNSLAAIVVGLEEGMEIELIQKALALTPPVAGRFEVIKNDKSPLCIVDYAHSPDGLDNILRGARDIQKDGSKLICLFGCGGDRDITKRPKMGKIAYDLADFVYVTSDNPRSEEPDQIIADILTGIASLDKVKVVPDRAQAIKESIVSASREDIVVIAGKGHEDYQILKTETIHFDDREEVRKIIENL